MRERESQGRRRTALETRAKTPADPRTGARDRPAAKPVLLVAAVLLLAVAAACAHDSRASDNGVEPLLTLTIDLPNSPSVDLPLTVAGWGMDLGAAEGTGVERVDVLDGGCGGTIVGQATYGITRPDVAAQHGERFLDTGWSLSLNTLRAGEHRLAARLRSAVADASACETVTVTVSPKPLLAIEDPSERSVLLPFRIGGWGLDLAAAAGPGIERVEVLDGGCEGEPLGRAEHGITRGDVAERYGHQFGQSGWQFVVERLSAGEHVLGVQLYSTVDDASTCQTITVSVL